MSEITTEPTENTTDDSVEDTVAVEPGEDATEDATPLGKQAAKFRKQVRQLETDNTALTEQITGLQKQLAENLIVAAGVKPEAIWAITEIAELLDDTGRVDPEKITATIAKAVQELNIRVKPTAGLYVAAEGKIPAPPKHGGRQAWDSVFTPKGH